MKRTRIAVFVLLLLTGSMYSASCGDLVIQSVKTGLLVWVSGNYSSSLQTGQINTLFNNLFTGGVTTPLPGST